MSPDQATEIGRRIINTMRPTPALPEWIEVLTPLDFDTALMTFRELRDHLDDGLRIGAWNAAYGRAGGRGAGPGRRRRNEPSEHCVHCRGVGFEAGEPIRSQANGDPVVYETVQPCRCTMPAPARTSQPSLLDP